MLFENEQQQYVSKRPVPTVVNTGLTKPIKLYQR